MDLEERYGDYVAQREEEIIELRKGQWTLEEDLKLVDCISIHGARHWSYLARSAGLNRTGKSCRLRWLNYLHPNVKRGNMTLEEQILILELHSRWGNRWSKIARELPGRTDNEIKNYYRTRVQKLANLLNCDVKSLQFRDAISRIWLPIMRERLQAASAKSSVVQQQPTSITSPDHIASNTSGYGLLEVEPSCTKSETPEEAGRVSTANSHLSYVDSDNVLGSDWWGSLQDESGLIMDVMSTAFSVGYYSEQEMGYEGGILMECSGAGLLGDGDSLEYLTLFNHDSAPTWQALNLS